MQGGLTSSQGGDFWTGFASGTLSSWAGSGYRGLGLNEKLGAAGMIGFGAFSGGIGAAATGGEFWQGAATGAIVTWLNHNEHEVKKWAYSRKEGVIVAGVVLEGPDRDGGVFGNGSSDAANRQTVLATRQELVAVADGLQKMENVADGVAVAFKNPYAYGVARAAGFLSDGINLGLDLYDGNYQNAAIRGGATVFTRFLPSGYSNNTKIVIDKVLDRTVNYFTK